MATRCPERWSDYKWARNDVKRAHRKTKTLYFSNLFAEVKNSISNWKLVKRATNPNLRKTIGPIRQGDDTLALQDEDKATSMYLYIATTGEKLNVLLPPPVNTHPVPYCAVIGEVP